VSKVGNNAYFCIIRSGVYNLSLAVGFVLGPTYILHKQVGSAQYSNVSQPYKVVSFAGNFTKIGIIGLR